MNPPLFATHWARELGTKEESLIQLKGGINNRVYRCGEGVETYVIKGYDSAEQDGSDRMKAEVEFLTYAMRVAPNFVPRLICIDSERRCVVLEHLQGSPYQEGMMPTASDVKAAVEFFRQLNADRRLAKQHLSSNASEGFLRLREHIANIRKRQEGMCNDHLPNDIQLEAASLLRELHRLTYKVANWTENLISGGAIADTINEEERIISPSDFGFHNAIRTPTGVKFFDFEFAGWDDPAKAAADFILQPRVPTSSGYSPLLDTFIDDVRCSVRSRYEVLGVILRLKWVAIILMILHPHRITKLLNTHQDIDFPRIAHLRLKKAARYLSEEKPFGLHRFHVPTP